MIQVYVFQGVMVEWDGGMSVSVILDHQWAGKVCGLCGNFDRITGNEFMGREGVILETANQFGMALSFLMRLSLSELEFY